MCRIQTGEEAGSELIRMVLLVMVTPRVRALKDVRFLTVAEVATTMRVSNMTVYRLIHNGDLPAIRVGRSFRVAEEDVDTYLQEAFVEVG